MCDTAEVRACVAVLGFEVLLDLVHMVFIHDRGVEILEKCDLALHVSVCRKVQSRVVIDCLAFRGCQRNAHRIFGVGRVVGRQEELPDKPSVALLLKGHQLDVVEHGARCDFGDGAGHLTDVAVLLVDQHGKCAVGR